MDSLVTVTEILKGSDYALTIFTEKEFNALELFDKGGKPYLDFRGGLSTAREFSELRCLHRA